MSERRGGKVRRYRLIGTLALAVSVAGCGSGGRREEPSRPVAATRAAKITAHVVDARGEASDRGESDTSAVRRERADAAQVLAKGVIPDGPAFWITGERHGMRGKKYLEIKVTVDRTRGRGGPASIVTVPDTPTSATTMRLMTGCAGSKEYVIAYGVLGVSTDRVIARAAGRERVLWHVEVPTDLALHRDLVYVALPWVPVEVVVRTASGGVVVRERYGGIAANHCPGGQGGTVGAIG